MSTCGSVSLNVCFQPSTCYHSRRTNEDFDHKAEHRAKDEAKWKRTRARQALRKRNRSYGDGSDLYNHTKSESVFDDASYIPKMVSYSTASAPSVSEPQQSVKSAGKRRTIGQPAMTLCNACGMFALKSMEDDELKV